MRINRIYSQSAFTLIELLVVISIISTLSSVVMGSITLARDRANFIKFKSDLVQIRTAIVLYRESNGGAWPSAIGDGHNGSINALASQLHAAGMYHSNTFVIPRMILDRDISGGDNYGWNVGCGSPESSKTAQYVYWFEPITSFGTWYANQFPYKYHGNQIYYDYRCFEFI